MMYGCRTRARWVIVHGRVRSPNVGVYDGRTWTGTMAVQTRVGATFTVALNLNPNLIKNRGKRATVKVAPTAVCIEYGNPAKGDNT